MPGTRDDVRVTHSASGLPDGPPGPTPHFSPQRPDHSPPELLGDDELARAIDSLARKLQSARRMFALATIARFALYGVIVAGGIAILMLGPVPFRELVEGERALATTWDVFAWWFAILAIASVLGAVAAQASRRRRRRAYGWRGRVEDLERRLDHALRVQRERRAA